MTLFPWTRAVACCGLAALVLILAAVAQADNSLLPPMNGSPADFALRRAGAEVNASLKISVTNEGIYRIYQTALTNAGVAAASLIGSQMRLYCCTQELAVFVSSDGLWTQGDYLVFYGQGFAGYYTITNVYWLGLGGMGKRMATNAAAPVAGTPDVTTCPWDVTYQRDHVYEEALWYDDESIDHWFSDKITNSAPTYISPLVTDQIVTTQPASATVILYGCTSVDTTNPDHRTHTMLNGGTTNFDVYFDGDNAVTGTVAIATSFLRPTNQVALEQTQTGVPNDKAYLKSFSLDYVRSLVSSGTTFIFTGQPGTNNYRVSSLSSTNNLRLFDVTDPANPALLGGFQTTNASGNLMLRFAGTDSSTGRYVVCQSNGLKTVSAMARVAFRNLANTNRQADYVVICSYDFRQPVYRLLARRYLQGLSVAVAPLPDIYNEFSYGIADAAAIKQFIGYAFHHWQSPPPKYVLLAGNGSFDPKRNLIGTSANDSYSAPDIIPVHMGPGDGQWVALDGWYALVNGTDNLVDVSIGRIPVTNATTFGNVVDKMISLENATNTADYAACRADATMVADVKDTANNIDFKAACQSIVNTYLTPAGFVPHQEYNDLLSASYVRSDINGDIADGTLLIYFFGHGAMDQWGMNDVYDTSDVYALSNTFYPLVIMLTCLNGYFQNPTDTKCMVEAFLETKHGACACMAATGLSEETNCVDFTSGLTQQLVTEKAKRLGDGYMGGCSNLWLQSSMSQELLFLEDFGDPAMIVNP